METKNVPDGVTVLQPDGVDVSHHQGGIDWPRLARAGVRFAIIKATEGVGFVDWRFAGNRAAAERVGILVGAYHFLSHDLDPATQARHFLRIVGPWKPGQLPPAIDVEDDPSSRYWHSPADLIRRVVIMANEVRDLFGRDPMIYSYPYFWRHRMGNTKRLIGYPLWIAHYGVTRPTLFGGWAFHTIHQYTSTGRVPGIYGNADRDRFNGAPGRLRVFAGLPED